jgi:hypothetical protein
MKCFVASSRNGRKEERHFPVRCIFPLRPRPNRHFHIGLDEQHPVILGWKQNYCMFDFLSIQLLTVECIDIAAVHQQSTNHWSLWLLLTVSSIFCTTWNRFQTPMDTMSVECRWRISEPPSKTGNVRIENGILVWRKSGLQLHGPCRVELCWLFCTIYPAEKEHVQ